MDQVGALLTELFIWSVPLLLLWRLLTGGSEPRNWHLGLLVSALLAIAASGLALVTAIHRLFSFAPEEEYADDTVSGRLFGPYAWAYWLGLTVCAAPLIILMFRRARRSWWALWCCALILFDPLDGFERLVIVVTSLHRDYLPSDWTLMHGCLYLITPCILLLSGVIMLWAQHRTRAKMNSAHSHD